MNLKRTLAFNKPIVLFLKLVNLYEIFYKFIYINIIEKKYINDAKINVNYLDIKPKISLIIPIYKVNIIYLKDCINSVTNQIYDNWEICLVDDNSQQDDICKFLDYCKKKYYGKVKVKYRNVNGNISVATNDAICMSTGEYIGLLDNDDIILPNCLYEIAKAINIYPDAQLIYTDEDKLLDKNRKYPFFKPDWDKSKIYIDNYISHFSVYKRNIFHELKKFNSYYDGAQDWEFLLRFSSLNRKVVHIRKVLYSWRITNDSTSQDISNKPFVIGARDRIRKNIKRGCYD